MVATQSSFESLMADDKFDSKPESKLQSTAGDNKHNKRNKQTSCIHESEPLLRGDDGISTDTSSRTDAKNTGKLTIVRRSGTFYNMYYRVRDTTVTTPKPWPKQEIIISSIMECYEKTRHVVAYIHGPPGTGKSTISIILGKRLQGSFYNTFTPWHPGESLNTVYAEVEPSEDCPLILAMDEIDESLVLIDKGIPPHSKLPIAVSNRSGWNKMMDEINIGLYPFLIMICTSNKPPGYLDASYLRDGRVDKIFSLN